jgi:hypothetical protein
VAAAAEKDSALIKVTAMAKDKKFLVLCEIQWVIEFQLST